MAHIELGLDETQFPGLTGLMRYRPETAGPMNALADVLLHAPHPSLSAGERELIAAYVSTLNDCAFCSAAHSAFAAKQLDGGLHLVRLACVDPDLVPLTARMRALLAVAAAAQRGGRHVDARLVQAARDAGAVDLDIHDAVLIAAAFCMFNRYVDGLGTMLPADPRVYEHRARRIAGHGYT